MFLLLFLLVIASCNPLVLGVNLSNLILPLLLGKVSRYVVWGNSNINNYTIQFATIGLFYIILSYYCIYSVDVEKSIIIYLKFFVPVIVYFYLCGKYAKGLYHEILDSILCYMCYANIAACIVGIVFLYFDYDINGSEFATYVGDVGGEIVYRMKGTFAQPNVFAGFLVLTFPGFIYKLRNLAIPYRLMLFFIEIFCLYKTYSRWSIIALIFSLVILMIKYAYDKQVISIRKLILSLLTLLLLILGISVLYNLGYFTHEGSNLERITALSLALQYAMDNDFLGYGLGIGLSRFPFHIILDGTFINLLVDTGLVGIFMYMIVCLLLVYDISKKLSLCHDLSLYMILWSLWIFIIVSINESILYNTLLNYFISFYLYCSNFKNVKYSVDSSSMNNL